MGTAVGAQIVVYATVDVFTLTMDGNQFAPTATARVKVLVDNTAPVLSFTSGPAEGATVDANIGGEGHVGIWSRTPFVDFDPFSAAAPYRYLLEFDPARTGDFEVRLILPRVIDIRGQYLVAGRETKAGAAQLYVGYCRPGEAIRRPFPASWDGRFEIVLFAGRFLVGPPGGPKIGCEEGMFSQDREHWMAILAPLRPPGGGSGFALRSIVRTRIAPEGMTATERPKFASDEPFDADSFVKAAAKALFGAPGKGTSHGEK